MHWNESIWFLDNGENTYLCKNQNIYCAFDSAYTLHINKGVKSKIKKRMSLEGKIIFSLIDVQYYLLISQKCVQVYNNLNACYQEKIVTILFLSTSRKKCLHVCM